MSETTITNSQVIRQKNETTGQSYETSWMDSGETTETTARPTEIVEENQTPKNLPEAQNKSNDTQCPSDLNTYHDEQKKQTEQPSELSKDHTAESSLSMIQQKLEEEGWSDEFLISSLKRGFEGAVLEGPKGTIIEDRKTRLSIAKEIMELKGWKKKNNDNKIVINNVFGGKPDQIY